MSKAVVVLWERSPRMPAFEDRLIQLLAEGRDEGRIGPGPTYVFPSAAEFSHAEAWIVDDGLGSRRIDFGQIARTATAQNAAVVVISDAGTPWTMDAATLDDWTGGLRILLDSLPSTVGVTWINPVERRRWQGPLIESLARNGRVTMVDMSSADRNPLWQSVVRGERVSLLPVVPWSRDSSLDGPVNAFLKRIHNPSIATEVRLIGQLITNGGAEAYRMAMVAAIADHLTIPMAHRLVAALTEDARPLTSFTVAHLLVSGLVENPSGPDMRLVQSVRAILLTMVAEIDGDGPRVARAVIADLTEHPPRDLDKAREATWSAYAHLDPGTVAQDITALIAAPPTTDARARQSYVRQFARIVRMLRVQLDSVPELVTYCDLIASATPEGLTAAHRAPATVVGITLPSPADALGMGGRGLGGLAGSA